MPDQTPRKPPRCSICGNPQDPWPGGQGYGNNAWPINNGRCCNDCNTLLVIPARLAQLSQKDTPHNA